MDFDTVLSLLKGKNAGALKALLQDDSRRALSKVLNEGDAKGALERARGGDTAAAKALFDKLISTTEGKLLVTKLLATLGGSTNG